MRIVRRVILAIAAGTLLVAGLGYVYLFKFGGVEKVVNARIASLIERRYNLEVTIGQMKGNFFSGIVLENVTVYYFDSIAHYPLLEINRLSAGYSLSNLWQKKYVLNYLDIDSAAITLAQDSYGHWLIPDFSSSGGSGTAEFPPLAIGDLIFRDTRLTLLHNKDTLNFNNITLSASLEEREKTYAIDLRQLKFTSTKDNLSVEAATGKATYSEGTLVFKDVEVTTGKTRIKLAGNVKLRKDITGRIDFDIDNAHLSDVSSFLAKDLTGTMDLNGTLQFAGKKLEGSINIAGDFMTKRFENLFVDFRFDKSRLVLDTLYGTILGNCTVDGSGAIDFSTPGEKYRLNAEIKNFNLKQLLANSFESNLSGHIDLEGESFRSEGLLLNVHTELQESSFHGYPLQEALGDLTITADSICFADSFRINYFENIFYLTGRIDYSDDILLAIAADFHNLDRFRGKLFINQPGGRGHADATLSGQTADPDLRGLFVSDSVWVYGLYSGNFAASVEIERFLNRKKGTVELIYADGSAWGHHYDSGHVFLSVDSNLVRIDTFSINNQYVSLSGKGRFDYGTIPIRMAVDTLALSLFDQTFYNRSKIKFDIDSSGFNFLHAAIGTSGTLLSLSGRINYDESMNFLLTVDNIPVGPWVHLFDTTLPLDGYISCRASVAGTFLKPQFSFMGSIDSLTYRDLQLGTLVAGLRYEDRLLRLDSLLIHSAKGMYRCAGSLHADLAFTSSAGKRFPNLPVDIHISASDSRFDLVSLVVPSVEQLDGDFFAEIKLSGTPHAPHLEGEAYIKNARLKYFDLEQPLFADSAGVTMKDNKIIIDRVELHAKNKKRGTQKGNAYIEGDITVKSLDNLYYDLNISLPSEFPFSYELDDIQGVVEGNLHVEGETPPLVTGDLTFVSMKYLVNFASEEEGSPLLRALSGKNTWDLNINIDIPSNYWIKNDDIDAEFSGQINLIRENGIYRFIGEMEILRGRGFLFDKIFRLEPGSRVIFEGNESVNPRLDITGYTRLAGVRRATFEETGTGEALELGIRVTGTLEVPEINPAEGSSFAREDILPLIVANYYSSDSLTSYGQIEHRLSGLISSQVSRIGTRQLGQLGVETFEIDHFYGEKYDPLKARVTLGFYTAPNLYVYGRSTLSGQTRQEVGFEYRFNKAFLLEGLRDEDELYHVALKLHWEF